MLSLVILRRFILLGLLRPLRERRQSQLALFRCRFGICAIFVASSAAKTFMASNLALRPSHGLSREREQVGKSSAVNVPCNIGFASSLGI
jgi:hypothetical protein